MDRQGDHPMEATVAELLEEGELQRHVRKMRGVYRGRRDFLLRKLEAKLGDALSWSVPSGGIGVWAKVKSAIDVPRWMERALARGVSVHPGARYTFDGEEPGALRLVFARFNEAELGRAVELLAAAL
jgi:GntR family transcriptional regulator/MocR family aminotransferase